jgi:hypothetical protein
LFPQAWLTETFDKSQSIYSGLPIINDTCPFHLRLYPTAVLEDDYVTNNPIIFTVCAVLIFAFTSAVFLLYDWMVELRQRKVMASAVQTSAIVSSLFPSTVRDRLFKADEDDSNFRQSSGLESFFFTHRSGSRPIADLYASATVMFADM